MAILAVSYFDEKVEYWILNFVITLQQHHASIAILINLMPSGWNIYSRQMLLRIVCYSPVFGGGISLEIHWKKSVEVPLTFCCCSCYLRMLC